MDSVIEVTGCKSNVNVTFDTQKEDGEAGEQKSVTQKTSSGKNMDCVIFLSSYVRDREIGKLHYLRVSGDLFCRKKETKGMLYD